MYQQFWSLDRKPFENNADPDFFYHSDTHQAALLKMRYVVENRLGAGLLSGGIGYGKTYLIHQLGQALSEEPTVIAHVVFPQMSTPELLAYLAVKLGANETTAGGGRIGLNRSVQQIEQQLTSHTKQGRHPILVIDEAHLIEDHRVFQALGLLLNFREPPRIDFSLILVGERELLCQVSRMAPLDERIAVKALLSPLSQEETTRYIKRRLEVAGTKEPVFDEQALQTLFELSGGVPRKINRLCDLALLVGYADNIKPLTAAEVQAVGEELLCVVPD